MSTGGSGGSDGGSVPGGDAAACSGTSADSWSTVTTMPPEAGAGGVAPMTGGNAGLIIIAYTSPTGMCSL